MADPAPQELSTFLQLPEVVNLQRKVRVDLPAITEFTGLIQNAVGETVGRTFVVAFVNDNRMTSLNSTFRGKDATTDVLSFPHEPDPLDPDDHTLGDIVISAEQAERQARENDLPLDAEIKQLILHGVLHLCGYDHETDKGEMDKREMELRQKLGIG